MNNNIRNDINVKKDLNFNDMPVRADLPMHQMVAVYADKYMRVDALRVPGGLLYITRLFKGDIISSEFVPFATDDRLV